MQTQEATETLAPRPRGFFAGLIHGNYFYPLSTVFFMLASFLLMPAQHVMGDKLFSTLQAAMILQGYELLLIISAAVIVRRLKILSDAFILLLIELLLLLDPTFFSNSFLGLRSGWSTATNVMLFLLAPLKLAIVLRCLRFEISPRAWRGFLLALGIIYLGPMPLVWMFVTKPPQAPHALYFYTLLWTIPAVAMILPRVSEAGSYAAGEGFATARQLLWTQRAVVLMPLGMLIVHALECVPVNEETLRFFPAQIAPLLLMAAFLRVRGAKERAGGIGLGWIDLLCVGALLLSLRGLNQMVLAPVNGMPSPVDVEPLFMQLMLPLAVSGLAVVGIYGYLWRALKSREALVRLVVLGGGGFVYAVDKLGVTTWAWEQFVHGVRAAVPLIQGNPRIAGLACLILTAGAAWRWRNDVTWFLCGAIAILLGMDLLPGPNSQWAAGYVQAFCALIVLVELRFHGSKNIGLVFALALLMSLVGAYKLLGEPSLWTGAIAAAEWLGLTALGVRSERKGFLLIAGVQALTLIGGGLYAGRASISPAAMALAGGLAFFGAGLAVTFNKEAILRWLPSPAIPAMAAMENPAEEAALIEAAPVETTQEKAQQANGERPDEPEG